MNEKTKNYFYEIPEGYETDYVIDAKDKKTSVLFTILSFVITAIVFVILLAFKGFKLNFDIYNIKSVIALLIFAISIFLYLVLHELTHGLVYKITTKEKLTFGLTLTVAFCGVPNIYVKKKAMILSILAPFVVFTILSVVGLILTYNNDLYYTLVSGFFGLHLGGCIGDLYGSYIMIFKYHNKDILVNDNGPTQVFYVKK